MTVPVLKDIRPLEMGYQTAGQKKNTRPAIKKISATIMLPIVFF